MTDLNEFKLQSDKNAAFKMAAATTPYAQNSKKSLKQTEGIKIL